jgi:ankyrin repeat protein
VPIFLLAGFMSFKQYLSYLAVVLLFFHFSLRSMELQKVVSSSSFGSLQTILAADETDWQEMLRIPALLEARDTFGDSLLITAIKKGLSKKVRSLLRLNVSPFVVNAKGKNACYYALKRFDLGDRDSYKIIRDLMLIGNCTNLWSGVIKKVLGPDLLEQQSVGAIFSQLFFLAIESNSEPFVKFLLSQGVGIDSRTMDDWAALHVAAFRGFHVLMEFLVANGADLRSLALDKKTLLHVAVMRKKASHKNCAGVVFFLIEHGAAETVDNVDVFKRTSLHYASENGCYNCVTFLTTSLSADVQVRDCDGMAPVHFAASSGYQKQIFECLIKNGASIDSKNKKSQIPLHLAAVGGFHQTVGHLIKLSDIY